MHLSMVTGVLPLSMVGVFVPGIFHQILALGVVELEGIVPIDADL